VVPIPIAVSGVVWRDANSTGAVMREQTGHYTIDRWPQLMRQTLFRVVGYCSLPLYGQWFKFNHITSTSSKTFRH